MDPLSEVLALLRPRGTMFRGLDAGGTWCVAFPRIDGIRCYAIVSGACWLSVDGVSDAVRLEPGDCVLVPGARACRLGSDLSGPASEPGPVFSEAQAGGIATLNGGGACFGIGGFFAFGGRHADMLLGMLPPALPVRMEADRANLRWCLDRLMQEMRDPRPGGALIAEHLGQMLLVQALRLHMEDGPKAGVGWLFALADRRLGAALGAMHAQPGRRWTLEALAREAGMSRSNFALVFKERVGSSALEYLTRWRMLVAADRLAQAREPISVIAPSLGYESESAFSAAFKRVMGCSPRAYGRGAG